VVPRCQHDQFERDRQARQDHIQRRFARMDRAAEIAREHVAEPTEVLHRQRLIEAKAFAQRCDPLRRRRIGEDQHRKVAGQQRHQKEAHQRHGEEGREHTRAGHKQTTPGHLSSARKWRSRKPSTEERIAEARIRPTRAQPPALRQPTSCLPTYFCLSILLAYHIASNRQYLCTGRIVARHGTAKFAGRPRYQESAGSRPEVRRY
jgi:hypothetical protein